MRTVVKVILFLAVLAMAACSHRKIKLYEKGDCEYVEATGQTACIED